MFLVQQGGVSDDVSLTAYVTAAMLELDPDVNVRLKFSFSFFCHPSSTTQKLCVCVHRPSHQQYNILSRVSCISHAVFPFGVTGASGAQVLELPQRSR